MTREGCRYRNSKLDTFAAPLVAMPGIKNRSGLNCTDMATRDGTMSVACSHVSAILPWHAIAMSGQNCTDMATCRRHVRKNLHWHGTSLSFTWIACTPSEQNTGIFSHPFNQIHELWLTEPFDYSFVSILKSCWIIVVSIIKSLSISKFSKFFILRCPWVSKDGNFWSILGMNKSVIL